MARVSITLQSWDGSLQERAAETLASQHLTAFPVYGRKPWGVWGVCDVRFLGEAWTPTLSGAASVDLAPA